MSQPTTPARSSAPDYASPVFARLRAESGAVWDAYVRHAFVEGLRTGDLPRAAFLHYLRQDYVFLIHFSRAWAFAVTKSDHLSEMKAAAGVVDALLNHEMQLHVETCAAAGLSAEALEATVEAPANLAYTRFVLDSGLRGDFLDLIAALAPCVLGYGEIGARLGATASAETPYGDWIATYAGADYQGVCAMMGGLLEEAAAARLGSDPTASPRWESLSRTFETATRLEVGFWDMGLRPD